MQLMLFHRVARSMFVSQTPYIRKQLCLVIVV